MIQVTANSERDALVQSLLTTLCELLKAQEGGVYWLGPSQSGPEARRAASVKREGVQLVFASLQNSPAILVASDADFSRCLETRDFASSPARPGMMRYVHPLHGRDGIEGFLEIIGPEYAEDDEKLVTGFLQVFRNYVRILDESERDTLTGLLNRRTFDRNIGHLLSQARMNDAMDGIPSGCRREDARAQSRWLAVLDVDHFKRVNDKFGHIYGDEVLILLAGMMRKVFREGDKLFRFGGEEFVAALEPTDEEGARAVLERLRQTVASFEFPQVGQVTISIGYVRISSQDVPATVVGHADEALYYAKQHGRNQVCSYEELLSQNKIAPSAPMNVDAELF
ncbi:MAG: GGDEF domain-containing protein [Nitrosomonadales bacterium]|nr:MAG: GGDEF domain-containing protein [Nitrosomonadales bacterium]